MFIPKVTLLILCYIWTEGSLCMHNKAPANQKYPLRLINFTDRYLRAGGGVLSDSRIISQLSKLEILDFFFPSLLIRKMPDSAEEAKYDYASCYICSPRKQGVLSNLGSFKQKLNNIEDCLLGNSRDEKTYKNYSAAHSMLRRAVNDLLVSESFFADIVHNLRSIYEDRLNDAQRSEVRAWMEEMIALLEKEETAAVCTAERRDGLFFQRNVYDSLLARASLLLRERDESGCWTWLCIGSLFGNYTERLMDTYGSDFRPLSAGLHEQESCRLIPSPSIEAKPGFCGREEYMKKIDALFAEGSRVIFLYGIGGIGKTEIARHYAASRRNRYDVIIHAGYDGSLRDLVIAEMPFELRPALRRLSDESDTLFFARKLDAIRSVSDERTLIILDNFNTRWDEDLYAFLNGRYRVLITTQCDYSKEFTSVRIREMDDMNDLISVFMNQYQGYAVERDDPDLASLIRYVSCHTYTVALLARHMEESGQTAGEMLDALKKYGIISLSEKIRTDEGKADAVYMNLIRLFSIIDFSDEEKKVLQLLSLIPISGIPPMVFRRWAELDTTKSILSLERRGWIMRTSGNIALHPVVQNVIRYILPANAHRMRPFLDHAAEDLRHENSWHYTTAQKEQYCLIVRSILSVLPEINDDTFVFQQSAAVLLGYSGDPETAIAIDRQLYQYCLDHYGLHSFETARSAFRVGWVFLFNPQLDHALENALSWLQDARSIFETITPASAEQKSMYCAVLANLSRACMLRYRSTGKREYLKEAEDCASLGTKLSREQNQEGGASVTCLLRLADVRSETGAYDEADVLLDEAYDILRPDHESRDPDILSVMSRKADVLYHLGKYRESLSQINENLSMFREFYGDNNSSLFDQLVLKYRNCIRLDLPQEAEKTKTEALRIGRKFWSADSARLHALDD